MSSNPSLEVYRMSHEEIEELAVSVFEDRCEAFLESQLQAYLNRPFDDEGGADCE